MGNGFCRSEPLFRPRHLPVGDPRTGDRQEFYGEHSNRPHRRNLPKRTDRLDLRQLVLGFHGDRADLAFDSVRQPEIGPDRNRSPACARARVDSLEKVRTSSTPVRAVPRTRNRALTRFGIIIISPERQPERRPRRSSRARSVRHRAFRQPMCTDAGEVGRPYSGQAGVGAVEPSS